VTDRHESQVHKPESLSEAFGVYSLTDNYKYAAETLNLYLSTSSQVYELLESFV